MCRHLHQPASSSGSAGSRRLHQRELFGWLVVERRQDITTPNGRKGRGGERAKATAELEKRRNIGVSGLQEGVCRSGGRVSIGGLRPDKADGGMGDKLG